MHQNPANIPALSCPSLLPPSPSHAQSLTLPQPPSKSLHKIWTKGCRTCVTKLSSLIRWRKLRRIHLAIQYILQAKLPFLANTLGSFAEAIGLCCPKECHLPPRQAWMFCQIQGRGISGSYQFYAYCKVWDGPGPWNSQGIWIWPTGDGEGQGWK